MEIKKKTIVEYAARASYDAISLLTREMRLDRAPLTNSLFRKPVWK